MTADEIFRALHAAGCDPSESAVVPGEHPDFPDGGYRVTVQVGDWETAGEGPDRGLAYVALLQWADVRDRLGIN